jgi:hypothetical protein
MYVNDSKIDSVDGSIKLGKKVDSIVFPLDESQLLVQEKGHPNTFT